MRMFVMTCEHTEQTERDVTTNPSCHVKGKNKVLVALELGFYYFIVTWVPHLYAKSYTKKPACNGTVKKISPLQAYVA